MSEEEFSKAINKLYNDYLSYTLNDIKNEIAALRRDMEKEHEDLQTRATTAETKLKLYEGLFSRLNLNMEVKNVTKG